MLNHPDLGDIVGGGTQPEERGTDLSECTLADDLEEPEVEERDFTFKVDRLRTTANGPHGVVEGEEEEETDIGQ